MERSKRFVEVLNGLTFLISISILGGGIWLANKQHSDCVGVVERPVVSLGVMMLVMSMVGFAGACLRMRWLLWSYLVIMFFLIVMLFSITVFSLTVTGHGGGQNMPGKAFRDYKLSFYTPWLQKKVNNSENWSRIRGCILDSQVCESLKVYRMASEFYKARLTSVQSGCCKPPTVCNYLFLNATYWARPLNIEADSDCDRYSYVQTELCLDCMACRAGVAEQLRSRGRVAATLGLVVFFILIILYVAACHLTFHTNGPGIRKSSLDCPFDT